MQTELVDTIDSLVELLRQHQLLSAGQLAELALRPPTGDPRSLARDLLQRGWLTPFQVNQLLNGRGAALRFGPYLMLERLGEGATGQVFKARHLRMQRVVALKLLRPELLTDPEVVQRFYREVQVISHLSHPHIVHAYDAGHIGRMHYLVMEHIDGADLAQVVKRAGPLPVAQVSAYLFQAALGLQHAHEKGLVHRDIKPSNLIVAQRRSGSCFDLALEEFGQVKILDLGLARLPRQSQEDENSMVTVTGQGMMGTPDFLAPEQALDFHTADIRSDLYSLGCTAYFLLAGEAPFAGFTLAQKLLRHQQCPPPPLAARRSDIPREVLTILDRLLAKTPEERYQTPAALAAALSPIVGATPPVPLAEPVPVSRSIVVDQEWKPNVSDTMLLPGAVPDTTIRAGRQRRRWLLFNTVGSVVLLGLLGLFMTLLSGSNAHDASPPPATVVEDGLTTQFKHFEMRQQRWISGAAEDTETLRLDLLRFQRDNAGSPQALQSVQILKDLPGPLDRLSETAIPMDQRRRWHPKDLVAVLGEQRGRAWGELSCVAVSPDGKLVAAGSPDGVVYMFDGETLADLGWLRGHTAPVVSVAFSPDGQQLVSCGHDYIVQVWTLRGPSRGGHALKHAVAYINQAVFAPSGKLLVVCSADNALHVWQAQDDGTWKPQGALKVAGEPAQRLAFSADGALLAAGGGDGLVHVWDVGEEGYVPRKPLKGHTGAVTALAFHPQRPVLFSASFDRTLRLWDLQDPDKSIVVHQEASYRPQSLSITSDGKRLCYTQYAVRPIQFWDLGDPAQPKQLSAARGNFGGTTAAVFAPGGKTVISVGEDRQVRSWDVSGATPQERTVVPTAEFGHGGISSVAVAPDGSTLACHGRYDAFTDVWDLGEAMPRSRCRVRGYGGLDPGMAFSPDGKVLYHSYYQTVLVTPLTGTKPASLELKPLHTARVVALGLSADGKVLATAGNSDQTIRLWDVAGTSAKERSTVHLKDPKALPQSLSFTPDGKTLGALAADRKLYLWNVSAGQPVERGPPLMDVSDLPQAFDFSPDGRSLGVLGSKDMTATLLDWTPPRTQVRKVLGGVNSGLTVYTAAFAPDGKSLAIAGQGSETIQVHDLANRKKPRTWTLPGPVLSVAFSSDGRHLVTGNGNGTVFVLRLAPGTVPTRP